MTWDRIALVMLGGAIGSLARYVIVTSIQSRISGPFPLGTFLVNVTGSFLIGVAVISITERWMGNPHLRLLVVIGLLGGYTTFSSLEYEAYWAVQMGHKAVAVGYVIASAIMGYIAVVLGAWLASRR